MSKGKYKRKRMNKMRRKISVFDTTLPTKVKNILNDVGIHTLYDLDCVSEQEIEKIPGIGEKYLEEIRRVNSND